MENNKPVAVKCKGIKKSFRSGDSFLQILKGIDLDIYQGELLMLTGPSGSGKTTLLSMIAGILQQDEGELLIFGQDLNGMKEEERAFFRNQNIGFVFQSYNLIPTLTVLQNISLPLIIRGVDEEEALAKANEFLTKIGMGRRADNFPTLLSGGEQQRVAIARALVTNPRMIICDEPTSALDQVTGLRIMNMLKEVALTPDRGLIVVTHDHRIYHFADRIAKINDGLITEIVKAEDEVANV